MLDPLIAQKFLELQEGKDFVAWLATEIESITDYRDVQIDDPVTFTIELKSRRHSRKMLEKLLNSFLVKVEKSNYNPKEYVA